MPRLLIRNNVKSRRDKQTCNRAKQSEPTYHDGRSARSIQTLCLALFYKILVGFSINGDEVSARYCRSRNGATVQRADDN